MTPKQFLPHSHGVCLALMLFFSGCEKPGEQSTASQTYPIRRNLIDNTGRPLEATIIGRNATSITVTRQSDGSQFVIPYTRLSAADQAFVVNLPLQSATLSAPREDSVGPTAENADKGILGFRRGKLEEVDAQIRKNENLFYQLNPKSLKGRSLRSENERLLKERAELAQEIYELESK